MNTETTISIVAAGALVLTAAAWDIRFRRIPNRLTGTAVASGVLFHLKMSGFEGLGWSVLGCGTGLAVLLVPYCLRAMGAGDVKLMMALGAWIGAAAVMYAFVYTAVWGGVLGLWMIYRTGMLEGFMVHLYLLVNAGMQSNGQPMLRFESSSCPPMPYGVVIALGFSTHVFLMPLAF